jgi:hypothetical protein
VDIGRSILAAPFDIRELGADMARLRPPLATITFIGMMFNSSNADLKHFFNATKSLASAWYVCKRLVTHLKELALYRRGIQVTSGNALAARLAKSALDLGVPLWTGSPARRLVTERGAVRGAELQRDGKTVIVRARHAVVLACGGFPHDRARIGRAYPHLARGGEHHSPVPEGNTGDGIALAEAAGARFDIRFASTSAWMPVSRVPMNSDGRMGVFPHLLDRYKPGVIGVHPATAGASATRARVLPRRGRRDDRGLRAASRETADVAGVRPGTALAQVRPGLRETGADAGGPLPAQRLSDEGPPRWPNWVRPAASTARSSSARWREYNEARGARRGPGSSAAGRTSFNRYLADPAQRPNPCVAPLGAGARTTP